MKKTIKIAVIVFVALIALFVIDTVQALAFDSSPLIKVREYYNGGNINYRDKGLLVDTWCGTNGKKDTVIKGFSYSLSDDTYDEVYKNDSQQQQKNPHNQVYDVALSFANWTDDSKIYTSSLNLSKMQSNSIQHLPIYKFDTVEDLMQFKTLFGNILTMDSGWDEIPSFNDTMVVSYFEKNIAAPKDESTEVVTAKPPKTQEELLYTDVSEDITAKDKVNLRSSAGTNFDVVTLLENGTVVKRTGIGKNGWSRLEYNGQTVYAITSYLTTELNSKPEPKPDIVDGNTFTPQNDSVTAKQEVNLRLSPATSGEIAGVLKNGSVLQRTATSNKGWSRLIYEGQTVYAITSYLTTDLSYKPPVDDGIKTEFQAVNEQITAKSETNLRTLPSVTDSEVVYTLKKGEYLTRTGISTNGWSRLEYNGQTVYAVSSYLTE